MRNLLCDDSIVLHKLCVKNDNTCTTDCVMSSWAESWLFWTVSNILQCDTIHVTLILIRIAIKYVFIRVLFCTTLMM